MAAHNTVSPAQAKREVMDMNGKPDDFGELPVGLGMALAQRPGALAQFAQMTPTARDAVVQRAHTVHSRAEMQALADELAAAPPSFE